MANILKGRRRDSRTPSKVGTQHAWRYYSPDVKNKLHEDWGELDWEKYYADNPGVPWTVALNAINFRKKEFYRTSFKYFALRKPPEKKDYENSHDYATVQATLREAAKSLESDELNMAEDTRKHYGQVKLQNKIDSIQKYLKRKQDEAIKIESQIYNNIIKDQLSMNKDYLNFVDNTKLNKGGQKISTLSSIENMSTIELWTGAAYNMLIPPGEKSFYEVLNEENKKQFAFFAYIKSKELYEKLRATGEMSIFSRHKARKYAKEKIFEYENLDTAQDIEETIDETSLLILDSVFEEYSNRIGDAIIRTELKDAMGKALGVYLEEDKNGNKRLKDKKINVSAKQVSTLIREKMSKAMAEIHQNHPNIQTNLTIKLGDEGGYFFVALDPTMSTSTNAFHKLKLQEQLIYLNNRAEDDKKTFAKFLSEDDNAEALINNMLDLIKDTIGKIDTKSLNLLGIGKLEIDEFKNFRNNAKTFCDKVKRDKTKIMARGLISDLWKSFNTANNNAFVSGLLGELGSLYSINNIFHKKGSMTGNTQGHMSSFGYNVNDLTYLAEGLYETDRKPSLKSDGTERKGIRKNSKETKLGINVKHYVDHTGNQFTLYKSDTGISINSNSIKKYLSSEETQLLRFISANSGLFSASFMEQMAMNAAYSNIPNFYRLQDRDRASAINVLFEINNVVYPLSYIYMNALDQLDKNISDNQTDFSLFDVKVRNKQDGLFLFDDINEARKEWDDDSFRISTRKTGSGETTIKIFTKGLNINLVSFGLFN